MLLNALVVAGDGRQIQSLHDHPDVENIYPNRQYQLEMDSAPALVGAKEFWELLGGPSNAGKGVKIGVVDSGINIEHPMLRDPQLTPPAGYPIPLEWKNFTNHKVIVARTYVDSRYGLHDQPEKTPVDERGHGSGVAAAAAGNTAAAPLGTISGIAPKAFLGNYKVFGDPLLNDTTTTAAILAALGDALLDGMDVVNLSLGGTAQKPDYDPEQQAIATLVDHYGVIVVVAAGNSGPGVSTVKSPGTSPEAITVGASSHNRVQVNYLEVLSQEPVPDEIRQIPYLRGTGAAITTDFGPRQISSIAGLDATELACSSLPPGSLTGQIALVKRGGCFFSTKAANVLNAAAAEAMVVYNNSNDPLVIMDFGTSPPQKPAVMIPREPGEALVSYVKANSAEMLLKAEAEKLAWESTPDVIAGFSSRGPSIVQEIKPDLVAPGQSIYTATHEGSLYRTNASGTSYATPIVAGAAALLVQLHPDWSPAQIKSALVSTAYKGTTIDGLPARVNETGNGRLDLERALGAVSTVEPVNLSYGALDPFQQELDQTIELTNHSSETRRYSVQTFSTLQEASITVDLQPRSFQLAPGQKQQVQCIVQPSMGTSGLFEGYLAFSDDQGGSQLTVPYWGVITPGGEPRTLLVAKDGPGYRDVQSALGQALPGDTIEISDSAAYAGGIQIRNNQDGILLHGLVLRAGQGASPSIQAESGVAAAIRVDSLRNVTLEGLTIQGGTYGIDLRDSTGILRDNILQSNDSNGYSRIYLVSSRAQIYGNQIHTTHGNGITLFDSPSLVQENRIGGLLSGPGRNGVYAGPATPAAPAPASERSSAFFQNQILGSGQNENGKGIRLFNTPVLLKANQIEATAGTSGDGISIHGSGAGSLLVDNEVGASGRFGVWLYDGAQAEIQGMAAIGNQGTALVVQDSSAVIRASRLEQSSMGIWAIDSNLDLSDSLLAHSGLDGMGEGHGLYAQRSVLSVRNSNLFGNRGAGISFLESEATVSNSILHENTGGDILGGSNLHITSNLLEDPAYWGTDGNFSGIPGFSDPENGDFTLQPGSDAIDRGNPELDHSRLDLLHHSRPFDGDGDGTATIDVGAVEHGSAFAPSLVLPVLTTSPSEFVGLALANARVLPPRLGVTSNSMTTPLSEEAVIRAFGSGGDPQGVQLRRQISTGEQISLLVEGEVGGFSDGWVEILPPNPDTKSFILLGNSNLTYLDGFQLTSTHSPKTVLPELPRQLDEFARVFFVNPNHQTAQLVARLMGKNGLEVDRHESSLPPRGSLTGTVAELFEEYCGLSGCDGYLLVESDLPISAMEIFGSSQHRGALQGLHEQAASDRLYAAHLAFTSQIDTFVNLVNPGPATAVLITARNDSGAVLGQPVLAELGTGEQWREKASEAFKLLPGSVGWIEFESSSSPILGSISFGDAGGRFLSSLPLLSTGAREFVLGHVAQTSGIFTGITLLNPTDSAALVTVEVFAGSGERKGLRFLELPPGHKLARLINDLFPEIVDQAEGFVHVRSNQKILGFEIFGSYSLEYMSAVPQQIVTP